METKRLARIISLVLYPAITGAVFTYALFLGLMGLNPKSFIYASIYASLITLVPFLILKILVKMGKLEDREVTNRQKRRLFFNTAFPVYIVSVFSLFVMDVPRIIIFTGISSFGVILAYYLISPYYKISIHTGILAFGAMVMSLVFGLKFLLLGLLLLPLIWSRYKLQKHTLGENFLGVLIGSIIPLILLKLFI